MTDPLSDFAGHTPFLERDSLSAPGRARAHLASCAAGFAAPTGFLPLVGRKGRCVPVRFVPLSLLKE